MLNRFVAALAALCLSTVGISADEPKPELSPVVQINGGCTGWHAGDGMIVTAGHCISRMADFDIVMSDGSSVTGVLAFFSHSSLGDDLAVIKIATVPNQGSLEFSCGPVPPVETVIHMTGYPAVYGLATVWGRVAGEPHALAGYWRIALPINISSYGGFSGSPVMTEDGLVIGVLVGSMPENKTLAFAVPTHRLCGLLALEVGA